MGNAVDQTNTEAPSPSIGEANLVSHADPSGLRLVDPPMHCFRKGDQILYYSALTHKWLLRRVGQPITDQELSELADGSADIVSLASLARPQNLRVEVTLKCNFNCTYCLVYGNKISQLNTDMTSSTAATILRWYHKEMPGGGLMLIGGEPMMNWRVSRQLLDGVPREAEKEFFTNALLLTDDDIEWLIQRNVGVRVSLDGFERHHQQRKTYDGHTMYKRIVNRLRTLVRAGADVGICCTVTPSNVDDLTDIHDYFVTDLGVRMTNYSIPHRAVLRESVTDVDMGRYTDAMLMIYEQIKAQGVFVAQLMRRIEPIVQRRFKAFGCHVIGPQVTFYPDGRKTMCMKLDSHPLTRDLDPSTIYRGLPFFMDDCRACPALGICGGGCYWDGQMRFGRFADLRECDFNRRLLERILWDVVEWSRQSDYPQFLNATFNTTTFA